MKKTDATKIQKTVHTKSRIYKSALIETIWAIGVAIFSGLLMA